MNGWNPSTTHPEYIEKTIKSGAVTIKILRPIFEESERAKRIETTRTALESVMRDHYKASANRGTA